MQKSIRSNLTVEITKFSLEKDTFYETKQCLAKEEEFYHLLFHCNAFKNGSNLKNKGYVGVEISVNFSLKETFYNYESNQLVCYVSVIDDVGKKHFTRSFCPFHDTNSTPELFQPIILINEYVQLQTLLDNPSEFLPNDTLTLYIEIDICFNFGFLPVESESEHRQLNNLIESSYIIESVPMPKFQILDSRRNSKFISPVKFKLLLNSEVTKTLCEVSEVLQNMLAHTAKDTSEFLEIPKVDGIILIQIFKILKAVDYRVEKVTDIFELLRVANKYSIPVIEEKCQQFIKEFLGSKMLPSYLQKNSDLLEILIQHARYSRVPKVIEMVEEFAESNDISLSLS